MIPASPILPLALALLCDALVGDPDWIYRRVPHPVVLIGRALGALDRAWNRPEYSETRRLVHGGAAVLVIIFISGLIGTAIHEMLEQLSFGWVVEGILMAVLLAQRSLYVHVRNVAVALDTGDIAGGRQAAARIVGRDTHALNEAGVSRSAIESLAENFSDGIVAPAFWAVLFGLPGMLAYKALNTADSMIGHRNEKYLHFGRVAARLDDVANFIPARLSGLLIAAAAACRAGLSGRAALQTMRTDGRLHRSVNAGYPEAAMAGALGVRLSGPRTYGSEIADDPWTGSGRDVLPTDIGTALGVFIHACGLLFLLVTGAAFIFLSPV